MRGEVEVDTVSFRICCCTEVGWPAYWSTDRHASQWDPGSAWTGTWRGWSRVQAFQDLQGPRREWLLLGPCANRTACGLWMFSITFNHIFCFHKITCHWNKHGINEIVFGSVCYEFDLRPYTKIRSWILSFFCSPVISFLYTFTMLYPNLYKPF